MSVRFRAFRYISTRQLHDRKLPVVIPPVHYALHQASGSLSHYDELPLKFYKSPKTSSKSRKPKTKKKRKTRAVSKKIIKRRLKNRK